MRRVLFLILVIGIASPLYAADRGGEFFTRGFGSQTCATYNAERSKNSPMYYLFRSWFNGYLSALNQVTPDTYDVVAGVNVEALSSSLNATCKQNPERQFGTAAFGLVQALNTQRLRNKSDVVTATAGNRTVMTTRNAIRTVQEALKERGDYGGGVDGFYGPRTRAAIEVFQRSQGLMVTGLPDQETLSALLSRKE